MKTAFTRLTPDRIGEINFLLSTLPPDGMSSIAAFRRVLEMAGQNDWPPVPSEYIEICSALSLIEVTDDWITLSPLGWGVKSSIHELHTFSIEQSLLLEPELVNHPWFESRIVAAVSLLRRWNDGSRRILPDSPCDDYQKFGLHILQALSLIHIRQENGENFLCMDEDVYRRIAHMKDDIRGKTECDLWADLEIQKLRARLAEELVVEHEKNRLLALGEQQLSECVERISEVNVSAGFDIRSFDVDGGERYIEVKSSTNSILRFFWSAGERRIAEEKQDSYWIYFVPRIHELADHLVDLTMVNNPISKIGISLFEEPSNFQVTMPSPATLIDQGMIGPTQVKAIS